MRTRVRAGKKIIGKKITACILAACMTILLAACGKKQAEAPELLEPVSGTESYREVVYGDVGTMDICFGTIVPTEYAHFWTTNVTIKEIMVDVGDYVQAGDVLATANLDVAQENLDALSSSLSLLQSTHDLQEKIHTLKMQQLTLKSEGLAAIGDVDGVAETATEIATEEENARYDLLLYDHKVSDLKEQMRRQSEIIEDGTLVAHASGYVSYVFSLVDGGMVDSTTNVVVIADYDAPYIQVQDKTIQDDLLSKYEKYYTTQNGKKELLKEYAYPADERMVAESQKKYPPLRMQYENENAMGKVGTVIPIFLVKNWTEDVLVVGNDSLYEDETGSFVYVKNGDKREQRYIETGNQDSNNTEVLSGLSEGEKVYYTSESVWPEKYEEYTAEIGNPEALVYTERYSVSDSVKKVYKSEYEGTVVSIHAADHANVQKGDLIAVIETNEGSARLAEMRNAIESTKSGYSDAKKAHEASVFDLEERKKNAQAPVQPETATTTDAQPSTDVQEKADAQTATGTDADSQVNPNEAAMLELDIQMANLDFQIQTLNYENQLSNQEKEYQKISCNNDGSGNCAIYAETDGVIDGMAIREGQKVKLGDTLYNISVAAKKKVSIPYSQGASHGSTVTMTGKTSGKVITGSVCGNAGASENGSCYLTTVEHKVYATQSVANDGIRTYVEVPDIAEFESDEKYMVSYTTTAMEDVIVIPMDMVYLEKRQNGANGEYYYVWKIVDGNLEKQYVNIQVFSSKYDTTSYNKADIVVCVLSGISEGDVLAREIVDESEE